MACRCIPANSAAGMKRSEGVFEGVGLSGLDEALVWVSINLDLFKRVIAAATGPCRSSVKTATLG